METKLQISTAKIQISILGPAATPISDQLATGKWRTLLKIWRWQRSRIMLRYINNI
jgi:hypothetical protein